MANEVQFYLGTFLLDSTNNVAIDSVAFDIQKSITEAALAKFHGSIIPIGKRKTMTIRVSGSVTGSNYDALRTNLDSLKNAFDDTAEKKFTTDDDRQIFVQYKSFGYSFKAIRTFATFSAQLVASWPYHLSQTLQSDERVPTSGVTYAISNAGNAPAKAKITITAPAGGVAANDIIFNNTTLGTQFQYRSALGASGVLIVNNDVDGAGLVVTEDGTSNFADFEGDFMTLAAGSNSFKITTSTAGVTVKIEWRDTYK